MPSLGSIYLFLPLRSMSMALHRQVTMAIRSIVVSHYCTGNGYSHAPIYRNFSLSPVIACKQPMPCLITNALLTCSSSDRYCYPLPVSSTWSLFSAYCQVNSTCLAAQTSLTDLHQQLPLCSGSPMATMRAPGCDSRRRWPRTLP
jgi:hypothetical protein